MLQQTQVQWSIHVQILSITADLSTKNVLFIYNLIDLPNEITDILFICAEVHFTLVNLACLIAEQISSLQGMDHVIVNTVVWFPHTVHLEKY